MGNPSESSDSAPGDKKPFEPYTRITENGKLNTLILPFPKVVPPPPPPEEYPVWPNIIGESCGGKILSGLVLGSVLGVGMGLFMGAMGDVSPIQIRYGKEVPQPPLREAARAAFKSTVGKMSGWAKSFGVLTALFGGTECLIEKYRAKHDIWNPVLSGCLVGGTMAAKGGPGAACVGCAGFAGFSFVVDKITGH